jgi:hypothetical protein
VRKELASEIGTRKKFIAVYSRMGRKVNYNGYSEETILLKSVIDVDTNKVVTDHIWFSYTKGFEKLTLIEGIKIEFEARVKEYKKGYMNKFYKIKNSTVDYKLSHPTKIKEVSI